MLSEKLRIIHVPIQLISPDCDLKRIFTINLNPLHAKYAYMHMGVVKKKNKKKTFHSWDRTRDYRIGRLALGHQGSWVFQERLCSYSFVNRVNYDTQIKHSACKGLNSTTCSYTDLIVNFLITKKRLKVV